MMLLFVASLVAVAALEADSGQESCAFYGSCSVAAGPAMMQQLSGLDTNSITIVESKFSGLSTDQVLNSAIQNFEGAVDHYTRSFDGLEAFASHLLLKMMDAQASEPAAVTELNDMIGKFVSSQSSSEDKCSSQLMEAKHQLNQLHVIINDLAAEINSTQTSIQVLQPQLNTKREELQKVEDWKVDALKKCQAEREERQKVLYTLQQELIEMHHIARPDVTMDISDGSVSSGVALLEENKPAAVSNVQALVSSTKAAEASLMKCVRSPSWSKPETGLVDISNAAGASASETPEGTPNADECENQKKVLEETYVKTYVELTRLIAEYEELIKSRSCEDTVNQEYAEKVSPLRKEITELVSKLEAFQTKLEQLRPRLEDAYNAEKSLRKQIVTLTKECASLPETITDLNKVRDVIAIMGHCPGLEAAEFNIPMWTEEWVEITQKSDQSDTLLDAAMNAACAAKFKAEEHPVRAAEIGEIMAVSIEGMPKTNTANGAIIGTCPLCEGDADADTGASHAAGHARACWEVGAELSSATMKKDCSNGLRSVLCVYDRGNIRDQTREELGSE